MELADLLSPGGNPGANNATPAPTAPAPQNAASVEQNKQGWVNALQEMVSQPENALMLIQMGDYMRNSPGANVPGALAHGLAMRGRAAEILRKDEMSRAEQQRKDRAADREDRRVGYEGTRVQQAERRLDFETGEEFEETQRKNRSTEDYQSRMADAAQARAKAAQTAADKPSASSASAAARDELINALMETEKLTRAEATVRADTMSKSPHPDKMAVDSGTRLYAAYLRNLLPGQPATKTLDDFIEEARESIARSGQPGAQRTQPSGIPEGAQKSAETGYWYAPDGMVYNDAGQPLGRWKGSF